MVLGINTLRDALSGTPKLEGESKLPNYFPVEPRGCEKHSARLFECLAGAATDKAREMEKAGLHRSWYPDVTPTPGDEKAAQLVREQEEKGTAADGGINNQSKGREEEGTRGGEEGTSSRGNRTPERGTEGKEGEDTRNGVGGECVYLLATEATSTT